MAGSVRVEQESPLAGIDLVTLGAKSGTLFRSSTITLVGLGAHQIVPVERPEGARAAQDALSGVGFAAFPFDRTAPGELLVPEIVLGSNGTDQWVTMADSVSVDDVIDQVRTLDETSDPPRPERVDLRTGVGPEFWCSGIVGAAIDRLSAADLRKVVLARELILTADAPFSIPALVRNLADRFPLANLFAVDGFIGASPELLVSRSGRTVRAHPLAGTASRGATAADDANHIADLLASTKDQTEHRITIEWLLSELLPYCSYVDAEPEPSVLTMANVHHLATLVEGVLSEPAASVLDLVAAVHPTPAVGGDPRDNALELIDELEGFDRGRYAGPCGWVDSEGNGEFAVSVRSAQVDGASARVCAGVGVVSASDPEAELAETQAKFQAMLGAFLANDSLAKDRVNDMKEKAERLADQAKDMVEKVPGDEGYRLNG
jgi:isochorismate synthase